MTYEVRGYTSEAAFNSVQFVDIEDGIIERGEAQSLARESLADFPIVKVQSEDREFIEILRRD